MLHGEGLVLRPVFQQKLLGARCGEADRGWRKEGAGDLAESFSTQAENVVLHFALKQSL